MRLFDTHVHLDDGRFDEDRPQVMARMAQAGVDRCITIGSDMASSRRAHALAGEHAGVYFAAGVHPHNAKDWQESDYALLEELLRDPKAVALGEIGLDYHYDHSPRTDQRSVFLQQLELAYKTKKPVILHVREAHGDMLELLRSMKAQLPPLVVHCYSGSWESAMQYMDLGCMVSLAGAVTFKNANKLVDVAYHLPMDRLLIETDCPYLAPAPHRGKRNEPAFVEHVARRIAEIRGVEAQDVAEATYINAMRFFKIS